MINFFDKLEDLIRGHLSRFPITYSFIGGAAVVLFWRGVWGTADILSTINTHFNILFFPPVQLVLSTLILMVTGLMVSVFIGDRIILSGLRHEKKLEERTEELVEEEVVTLYQLKKDIGALNKKLEKISHLIKE